MINLGFFNSFNALWQIASLTWKELTLFNYLFVYLVQTVPTYIISSSNSSIVNALKCEASVPCSILSSGELIGSITWTLSFDIRVIVMTTFKLLTLLQNYQKITKKCCLCTDCSCGDHKQMITWLETSITLQSPMG